MQYSEKGFSVEILSELHVSLEGLCGACCRIFAVSDLAVMMMRMMIMRMMMVAMMIIRMRMIMMAMLVWIRVIMKIGLKW